MGRPSNFQAWCTELANQKHSEWQEQDPIKKNIKDKIIKINSPEELPEIFSNRQMASLLKDNYINNKELEKRTGKDKGHISRLLSSGNMHVKTFLELCKALELEVYVRGLIYEEKD